MTQTCRNCNRTFTTELKYRLHVDTCGEDELICGQCGERFSERHATEDGWHYSCPNEECDGEGIGEDLYLVNDVRLASR